MKFMVKNQTILKNAKRRYSGKCFYEIRSTLKSGKVGDVKVVRGVNPEIDAEAVRVVIPFLLLNNRV